MKLTWLGHSAFKIEIHNSAILIDPFITGNPLAKHIKLDEVMENVTHILLTHGHYDHVGDTVQIAKETGAKVTANYDLCQWLIHRHGLKNIDACNTGGTLPENDFSVTFVNAVHTSSSIIEDDISHSLGGANGVMLHMRDAPSLLHMGDTDIFSDMALINELHQPDIGIVPIGDRATMGGAIAALCCQRYFNFETIIPCHYGSFPVLDQTADLFVQAMDDQADKVIVPKIGEITTF